MKKTLPPAASLPMVREGTEPHHASEIPPARRGKRQRQAILAAGLCLLALAAGLLFKGTNAFAPLSLSELGSKLALSLLTRQLPPVGAPQPQGGNAAEISEAPTYPSGGMTAEPPLSTEEASTTMPSAPILGIPVGVRDISQWLLGADHLTGGEGAEGLSPSDVPELLPLGAAVLIIHSHPYETYGDGGDRAVEGSHGYAVEIPQNGAPPEEGVVSLGQRLATLLRLRGKEVYHAWVTAREGASHLSTYQASEEKIAEMLERYPQIGLVIDLGRSGDMLSDGSLLRTRGTCGGEVTAQIRVSVDLHRSTIGRQRDLDLGMRLRRSLYVSEKTLSTPVSLKRGAVLCADDRIVLLTLEIGAAGNTYEEALRVMAPLADGLLCLWEAPGQGDPRG